MPLTMVSSATERNASLATACLFLRSHANAVPVNRVTSGEREGGPFKLIERRGRKGRRGRARRQAELTIRSLT